MDSEAPKFGTLLLAVGFEDTTTFISSTDENRLGSLNAAVSAGGEPVGFIGTTLDGDRLTFQQRVLDEYAGEDWAKVYMGKLIALAAAVVKATDYDSATGWVN